MTIPNYTLVVGVDRKHLYQLSLVWPTWKRYKPSLLTQPMLVFFDHEQVREADVRSVVDHPSLVVVPWPPPGVTFTGNVLRKWGDPQRYAMLAGFVHVPARSVHTPYWLKLDTDVVATGQDNWVNPAWFENNPAIISHPWAFTKPADQMLELDRWVDLHKNELAGLYNHDPLKLVPTPGSERLGHKRIISFVGFFNTMFSRQCAAMAGKTCGRGQLPVRSQDGYLFYAATRMGLEVKRVNMKRLGWEHWSTDQNVKKAAERAVLL